MNAAELAIVKRAIQTLRFEGKLHLSRTEIGQLIEELNQCREYKLADYVRSMDPAQIAGLLR